MKDDRLDLYKSLFKGREDVFAIRWEKSGKSNYMPAYSFDPHRYRLHQIKGGTFQNFTDKSYQVLTDDQLIILCPAKACPDRIGLPEYKTMTAISGLCCFKGRGCL